jgi:hypothetical protein
MAKYIKPTLDTPFHIDFAWWQEKSNNLRGFLQGHVCTNATELLAENEGRTFDWVDPAPGEVFTIDLAWHIIYQRCQNDPDFFDPRIPLTTAIFRAFIANNNKPLTPVEIFEKIQKKNPEMILGTIGSRQIYKGIKPVDTSI